MLHQSFCLNLIRDLLSFNVAINMPYDVKNHEKYA